jgi:hypothetical protein
LATALREGLAILTEDAAFARLASESAKGKASPPAVIPVRRHGRARASKVDRIVGAVGEIGGQPALGSVHVVEPSRLRKRLLRRDFD